MPFEEECCVPIDDNLSTTAIPVVSSKTDDFVHHDCKLPESIVSGENQVEIVTEVNPTISSIYDPNSNVIAGTNEQNVTDISETDYDDFSDFVSPISFGINDCGPSVYKQYQSESQHSLRKPSPKEGDESAHEFTIKDAIGQNEYDVLSFDSFQGTKYSFSAKRECDWSDIFGRSDQVPFYVFDLF